MSGLPGRASPASSLELALGLLIVGLLLTGVRAAWRGRRAAHVRTMKLALAAMLVFLALFTANALLRGEVEALGQAARGPAFIALLLLHVVLSLLGGVLVALQVRWGLAALGGDARAQARHRRLGGFIAGYWLVNGLLGALVYCVAYVL